MAFVYKSSDRPFLRVAANTGAAVARLKSARLVTPSLVEASPRIWTVAVLSARTETVTVETMAEEMTDRMAEMVEVMAGTTEAHDGKHLLVNWSGAAASQNAQRLDQHPSKIQEYHINMDDLTPEQVSV